MAELTEEQIDMISKTIEDTAHDPMQEARELAENSTDKNISEVVNMGVNVDTGKLTYPTGTVVSNDADIKDIIAKGKTEGSGDNMLETPAAEQLINKIIHESFPKIDKLSNEDMDTFKQALKKYRLDVSRRSNTKSFSYYNAMPECIKQGIVSTAGASSLNSVGNFEKEAKNFMAGAVLDGVLKAINETKKYVDLNTVNIDSLLNDDEDDEEVDLDSVTPSDLDIFKLNTEYFETRLVNMIEDCERNGETAEADRGRAIKASYIAASELTDLIDTYKSGKLKIKKIMLEKYEREFRAFNLYYESTANVITDINKAYSALLKAFPEYSKDGITKAMLVFTQYARYKHFDPDNIIDHTFMFYFIQNCIISCVNIDNAMVNKFKQNMKTLLEAM